MESQGIGASKLGKMRLLYQQKQKEEMERKRNELTDSRSTLPMVDHSETNRIQIGNGKVRQMFDKRRQRVTGIDKSYPLLPLPISSKCASNDSIRQYKNMVTSITTDNQLDRKFSYSKLSDADYIENEKIPDIFSQLDDIDTLDTGRRVFELDKQMMDLNVNNGKIGSDMKLGPVITRKSFGQKNSASSLNTAKRLPAQLNTKEHSITDTTSEKVSPPPKKDAAFLRNNTASSRSSASSNSSIKKSPRLYTGPGGVSVCKVCRRSFDADRIEKHETICKRSSSKKRKIFDATKHRVKGTEAEVYVKKNSKISKISEPDSAKKINWRRKHEEFIQAIRSAKQVQQHLAKGGKLSELPPPTAASPDPDYVQCPTCKRRFNCTAGERHIPKCANYQFNKPKPNNSTNKKHS